MTIQDEVRALLAAATPGPRVIASWDKKLVFAEDGSISQATRAEDAALIVRAPDLLAALCDKLDEAEDEIERICSGSGWLHDGSTGESYEELLARAEKAEAAIERVLELCNTPERWLDIADVLAALDGE